MAIHIGHRRAGFPGLLVAGTCFILPAMLIVMACAWGYVRFGKLPQVEGVLYGIKPVVVAVVVQALWGLGKSAVKTRALGFAAFTVTALGFLRVNELALLFGAGAAVAILRAAGIRRTNRLTLAIPLPLSTLEPLFAAAAPVAASTFVTTSFGLWPLFCFS